MQDFPFLTKPSLQRQPYLSGLKLVISQNSLSEQLMPGQTSLGIKAVNMCAKSINSARWSVKCCEQFLAVLELQNPVRTQTGSVQQAYLS